MWQGHDANEDLEDGQQPYGEDLYGVKPSYIIAIEVDEKMFYCKENVARSSYFKEILRMLRRIYESVFFIYKSTNPIAVLLTYDDEDKVALINYSNTIIEAIKTIEKLLVKPENILKEEIINKSDFSVANFIFTCQRKFNEAPKSINFDHKLFYVTRNDNPLQGIGNDLEENKFRTLNTLKVLQDSKVNFQVLVYKTTSFDEKFFYEEVAKEIPKTFSLELLTSEDDLFSKLWKGVHVTNKRTTKFYWNKNNAEDYFLVNLVSVNKKQSLLRKRALRQNLELVQQRCKRTEPELEPVWELKSKNLNFSHNFSKDQYDSLRMNVPNGLCLDSVTSVQHRLGYSVKKNHVLFLNDGENVSPQDVTIFNAMWDNCQLKHRVIICFMRLQRNHRLQKIELEPTYVDNMRSFILRVLPTANNIRYFASPQFKEHQKGENCAAHENLVNQLFDRLLIEDFHPMQIENPRFVAQKQYVIDRMLERDFELPTNMIKNCIEQVKEKIEDLCQELQANFVLTTHTSNAPKAKRAKKNK